MFAHSRMAGSSELVCKMRFHLTGISVWTDISCLGHENIKEEFLASKKGHINANLFKIHTSEISPMEPDIYSQVSTGKMFRIATISPIFFLLLDMLIQVVFFCFRNKILSAESLVLSKQGGVTFTYQLSGLECNYD